MRRFIVTSPKFKGEAELIYKADGLLQVIDCSKCNMDAQQIFFFKKACPLTVMQIENGGHELPNTVTIIERDFEVTFEMFWKEYPYKRNRHLAEDIWHKLKKSDQIAAWQGAIAYAGYCNRNKWYNAKIANLWLTKKEYLNDWNLL